MDRSWTKLDADKVREIRALASAGVPHQALAAKYAVSEVTVGNVVRMHTWASVPAGADDRGRGLRMLLGPCRGLLTDRERGLLQMLKARLVAKLGKGERQ